jgi:NACHT domain- and WD repeat-containing protein
MPQSSRTFRVFVSSTFSDLEAERNALQKQVFPRLRDLATSHGCRFQAIDLRWGVSEEASLNQQAMKICLGEIERCQKVTPRPNFIVLLGNRYGWCPLPYEIPAFEFEQIIENIADHGERLLVESWYWRDENAVPPTYFLQPRTDEFVDPQKWASTEEMLHSILEREAVKTLLPSEELRKYTTSATEQEILAGAWKVPDARKHVFGFFREINGLPLDNKDFGNPDPEAGQKQANLKGRLKERLSGNIHECYAHWLGDGPSLDHIDKLCEDVYASLSRIILDEIEHPHEIFELEEKGFHIRPDRMLDTEGLAQYQFAEERLRFFVGRTEMLANIEQYLQNNQHHILAIVGAGGSGKSALMSRAIQQTQADHPKAEIIYRFIGATPGSSDGRSLLDSLCHEIARRYAADTADMPSDYRELVPELGKRMGLASAEHPLVLFLDSLDQLSTSQGARSLIWLPNELPEHVSVITSTRAEDTLKALQAKQAREERLGGLSRQEGDELLSQWLASVGRTLQAAQRQEGLDKFEKSNGNPLYLRLAFEEARLWTSNQSQEQLEPGVSGIIEKNMLDRLKNAGGHGETLVSHALGYLAASRYGLAEDELIDLLSRDLQVYRWFMQGSHHLPADLVDSATQYRHEHPTGPAKAETDDETVSLEWLSQLRRSPNGLPDFLKEVLPKADGPRLPVVLWSRLSFDLEPYLAERMLDGSALLNFYHRELGEVATRVFLTDGKDQPFHARLADYFRFKADSKSDRTWSGNSLHGLSELPYHLTKAALYDDVFQTLTDFKFLENKAAEVGVLERMDEKGNPVRSYAGVLQLQEDYEMALKAMPGGESGIGRSAPLILTALETSQGLMVYCPVCNKYSPIQREMLDKVIACPQEGCKAPIKLNPFTVKREI